jgi:hypothetical protein
MCGNELRARRGAKLARALQTLSPSLNREKGDSPMADPTQNDSVLEDASSLAAAARDRGMEQLEGAKGQLAEGAERIAAAVDRTADELDGEGGDTISGFGHSVASLMRQLAGGLRERDVEQFASELGHLARRNPGVFLAGSVALGFGVARFFKARSPRRAARYETSWQERGATSRTEREEYDADESLDLSGNPVGMDRRAENDSAASEAARQSMSGNATPAAPVRGDERAQSKSRNTGRKAKSQRASAGGSSAASADTPLDEATTGGVESTFSDDTGGKGP